VASLIRGTLRYALAELAALPGAAIVVEDRYSGVFKLDRVRPAMIADGLAELQVRWPNLPIVFCETRPLAEDWTYRYLASLRPEDRSPRDPLPGLTYSVTGPSFAWSARSSRTRCWVRTSRMVVTNPTPPTRLPNADHPAHPTSQVTERRAGVQSGEHEQRVEHRVKQLPTGEECSEQDGRNHLHTKIVRGVPLVVVVDPRGVAVDEQRAGSAGGVASRLTRVTVRGAVSPRGRVGSVSRSAKVSVGSCTTQTAGARRLLNGPNVMPTVGTKAEAVASTPAPETAAVLTVTAGGPLAASGSRDGSGSRHDVLGRSATCCLTGCLERPVGPAQPDVVTPGPSQSAQAIGLFR